HPTECAQRLLVVAQQLVPLCVARRAPLLDAPIDLTGCRRSIHPRLRELDHAPRPPIALRAIMHFCTAADERSGASLLVGLHSPAAGASRRCADDDKSRPAEADQRGYVDTGRSRLTAAISSFRSNGLATASSQPEPRSSSTAGSPPAVKATTGTRRARGCRAIQRSTARPSTTGIRRS